MTMLYIGLNRGQVDSGFQNIATGSSTQSTDVELRIDLSKSLTRFDVFNLTENILRYVNGGDFNANLPL